MNKGVGGHQKVISNYSKWKCRLSRDPRAGRIGVPVSLHKYLYAGADPANRIDPSGRNAILEFDSDEIDIAHFGYDDGKWRNCGGMGMRKGIARDGRVCGRPFFGR